MSETDTAQGKSPALPLLAFTALGVAYGDIGTNRGPIIARIGRNPGIGLEKK